MPSPTLQDEAQTVMRNKLTNGTGNRSSHVTLFLFIAVDEHDRGRFDIGYPFRTSDQLPSMLMSVWKTSVLAVRRDQFSMAGKMFT